jgi:hypothetical protein
VTSHRISRPSTNIVFPQRRRHPQRVVRNRKALRISNMAILPKEHTYYLRFRAKGSTNEISTEPEIREMDQDKAIEAVTAYFDARPNEPIYPDEIAKALSIPVGQAIEICDLLLVRGVVR